MLADFVSTNREAIIAGTRERVASRAAPKPSEAELLNGIPIFLDQLGEALVRAQTSASTDHEQLSLSAARHGRDLLRMGLSIGQVVHDYGDVCQTVTSLAVAQNVPISTEDFKVLNLCLDDAIAEAVTEFSRSREGTIADAEQERLGTLAHELRNLLNAAMLAFELIKTGRVAVSGSTGQVLDRNLLGLRDLVDRSLADVRLDAGIEHRELIAVAELVEEIEIGASLQAKVQGLSLAVSSVDRTVWVEGDRQIIAAAVANLLQNAFKFTHKRTVVALRVRATADRVLFEIEDECGGLPPGKPENLFRSFAQRGSDHSGLGLGLSICRKAAQASAGLLHVRDLPGKGCVFTLDLPRKPPPPLLVVGGASGSGGPIAPRSGGAPNLGLLSRG
ncbi:HAMP domain-containing sensor histidine kinase [Nannocystis sp.]|uniref:sensor histidine kinase n=1 Tax=Nannocystis sp. TaxID=1962667 RepID=UPI0025EEAF08|nr:HAMP domain-containing sensor histidine kinase [Nannocystis sp.]MBK7828719.1 HAMP domain-containing histidine kinase [Nannocystis sp.]